MLNPKAKLGRLCEAEVPEHISGLSKRNLLVDLYIFSASHDLPGDARASATFLETGSGGGHRRRRRRRTQVVKPVWPLQQHSTAQQSRASPSQQWPSSMEYIDNTE
jgi:hypothetical protein